MGGENPTGGMGDAAAAVSGGFATDNLVAGGWGGGGGFEMGTGGGGFLSGATFGDSGITFAGTGGAEVGGAFSAGDAVAEMPQAAMIQADSAAEANLIISKDADGNVTHTWNKPLDASNGYQCAVFVDGAVQGDAAAITSQLQLAKSEAANGVDAHGKQIASDGKKLAFQVPDTLPEYMTKKSDDQAAKDKDKEQGDPEDEAPSGGGGEGGGGSNEQPADDDLADAEKQKEAEAEQKAEEAAAKANSTTLKQEAASQLDKNGGMSHANMASYANNIWSGSMMSNLFSKYDKDGDGELSPEEMAEMEKDPTYKDAQKELQDKIGNDSALADFKSKIGTADGLSSLNQLQKAGDNAQASDVNKVFNSAAQSAISSLAVKQEIKSAGLDGNSILPAEAAAKKTYLDQKIAPILDKLVNGKHIFNS